MRYETEEAYGHLASGIVKMAEEIHTLVKEAEGEQFKTPAELHASHENGGAYS
jgi:hypothetical protein